MSISHHKINSIIKNVIEEISEDLPSELSMNDIEELCKQVYLIESSVSDSSHSKINDIKDKIIIMSENN